MSYTERFTEGNYPLDYEHADSLAVGTHRGGSGGTWLLVEDYHRLALYVNLGDMGAGASFNISVRQATSALGAGDKAITGKAITQRLQASGHGNDLMCVEIRTEEMDVSGLFSYLQVQAVVGGAAVEYSWTLFARVPRFRQVPTTNWTEIID